MVFSYEDKVIIRYLRQKFGHGPQRIKDDHPEYDWNIHGLKTLLANIDKTGEIKRKEGSGRPRTIRNEENIEAVEEMILSQEDKPGTHSTPTEISLELGIPRSSVYRIIDEELALRPLKKQKVQRLSDVDMEKRLVRSQRLLRIFTMKALDNAFFSDEKIFKLNQLYNRKNDVVYAPKRVKKSEVSEERILREHAGFPEKVMVSVGISKAGKTSVLFVDEGCTVNADYYCNNLLRRMIPEMNKLVKGKNKYLFMQDGARAHTARISLEMLRDEKQLQLLEPTNWPPNSPDINPVDYCIWGTLERNVYRGRKITDLNTLKSAIVEEWAKIPQETINRSIDAFRSRLRKVIKAEGGHIERY
jgi:hypothetical protein